jgi:hypothetical protein
MSRRFGEVCVWRARDRSAQALQAASLDDDAARLAGCRSLDDLLVDSKRVLQGKGVTANLASYLAEAIEFLAGGDTPCSTYISARAAVAASGSEPAFGAEREAQARCLADALGL